MLGWYYWYLFLSSAIWKYTRRIRGGYKDGPGLGPQLSQDQKNWQGWVGSRYGTAVDDLVVSTLLLEELLFYDDNPSLLFSTDKSLLWALSLLRSALRADCIYIIKCDCFVHDYISSSWKFRFLQLQQQQQQQRSIILGPLVAMKLHRIDWMVDITVRKAK